MKRRFRLTIGGHVFHGAMQENSLVEQIAKMCPFEQKYTKNPGEYYTKLPQKVNQSGCNLISDTRKNQICFFEAWNAFNIVLEDGNIAPFKIAYLGDMEEDVSEFLKKAGNEVVILCEDITDK